MLAPFALRNGWRDREPGAESTATTRSRSFVAAADRVRRRSGSSGYWFQNAGLQHTTTSNSAFITGLFVVFTPIIETVVTRRAPEPAA